MEIDNYRVKNPGRQIVLGGDNVSPLVEIGLTDPPKSGGAAAPPASHLAACLESILQHVISKNIQMHTLRKHFTSFIQSFSKIKVFANIKILPMALKLEFSDPLN